MAGRRLLSTTTLTAVAAIGFCYLHHAAGFNPSSPISSPLHLLDQLEEVSKVGGVLVGRHDHNADVLLPLSMFESRSSRIVQQSSSSSSTTKTSTDDNDDDLIIIQRRSDVVDDKHSNINKTPTQDSSSLPPVLQQITDERRNFQMNLGKAMDTLRKDYPYILKKTPGTSSIVAFVGTGSGFFFR
jgi:hypothetical protein